MIIRINGSLAAFLFSVVSAAAHARRHAAHRACWRFRSYDIVNAQNHLRCFAGRFDCLGLYLERLNNTGCFHVSEFAVHDVYTIVCLAFIMKCPKIYKKVYCILTCGFCKSMWNYFYGFRKGVYGQLLSSADTICIFPQFACKFYLNGTAASDQFACFHSAYDSQNSVVHSTFGLVDNMFCSTSYKYGNSFWILTFSYKDHFLASYLQLFNNTSIAYVILCEFVYTRNNVGACCLSKFFNIALFDTSGSCYTIFCKVMLCQVINALLAKDHVTSAVNFFLHHVLQHS